MSVSNPGAQAVSTRSSVPQAHRHTSRWRAQGAQSVSTPIVSSPAEVSVYQASTPVSQDRRSENPASPPSEAGENVESVAIKTASGADCAEMPCQCHPCPGHPRRALSLQRRSLEQSPSLPRQSPHTHACSDGSARSSATTAATGARIRWMSTAEGALQRTVQQGAAQAGLGRLHHCSVCSPADSERADRDRAIE